MVGIGSPLSDFPFAARCRTVVSLSTDISWWAVYGLFALGTALSVVIQPTVVSMATVGVLATAVLLLIVRNMWLAVL
jgi:hypothetical protein